MTTLPFVVLQRSQSGEAHGLSFTVDSLTVEVFGTLPEIKALGERLVRYAEHGCWACAEDHELAPEYHRHDETRMDAAIKQAEDDLGCADLPRPHAHPR